LIGLQNPYQTLQIQLNICIHGRVRLPIVSNIRRRAELDVIDIVVLILIHDNVSLIVTTAAVLAKDVFWHLQIIRPKKLFNSH